MITVEAKGGFEIHQRPPIPAVSQLASSFPLGPQVSASPLGRAETAEELGGKSDGRYRETESTKGGREGDNFWKSSQEEEHSLTERALSPLLPSF